MFLLNTRKKGTVKMQECLWDFCKSRNIEADMNRLLKTAGALSDVDEGFDFLGGYLICSDKVIMQEYDPEEETFLEIQMFSMESILAKILTNVEMADMLLNEVDYDGVITAAKAKCDIYKVLQANCQQAFVCEDIKYICFKLDDFCFLEVKT